ncbi:MAG: alkaline phosphatase family protein [Polyangiales bacterium]
MIVVGLDCAAPGLVFDRYRDSMPNVSALMERGTWGPMRSSEPPITVPAWTCMVSGRDPGELGLYGFRNRVEGETGLRLCSGHDVRVKRVWDWLGDHGHRVAPLFVPLTSPPRPVRGHMISGFMWSGDEEPWAFPESLAAEIEAEFGTYKSDVENFRADDLDRILDEVHAMTEQHFDIAEHIWSTKKPDFMMMVEIGVDRFHHAFWHHIDPAHPRHVEGNAWADAGRTYYGAIDRRIGDLIARADDDTAFLVVSDHGARAMHGGFCINDWLVDRGYLVLKDASATPTRIDHDRIDWSRTRVWAEGGYYARVFLNVAGREPSGVVDPSQTAALKMKLRGELSALRAEDGQHLPTLVHDPLDHYRTARGFPPDLMVYFDDLSLRAIGSVGHPSLVVQDNDIGPDSCNHDWDGIFILSGGGLPGRGRIDRADIYDVTPTVLGAFGVERPPHVLGRDWTATAG